MNTNTFIQELLHNFLGKTNSQPELLENSHKEIPGGFTYGIPRRLLEKISSYNELQKELFEESQKSLLEVY